MKLKRVGAVLAGAALLGATLAGAAAGADMDAPDRGFFIDETTGLNNCLIVVGSDAAAADVVSAAFVSAKIGSMAYYEEITENWTMPGVTYTEEEDVDNYGGYDDGDGDFDDYRFYNFTWAPYLGIDAWNGFLPDVAAMLMTTRLGPISWVVLPYTCEFDGIAPWWDYDVYVDAWTDFGVYDNFLVDTGCSYEAITVDFSVRDVECTAEMCIGCSAACDQRGLYEYNGPTLGGDDVFSGDIFTFDEMKTVIEEYSAIRGTFSPYETLAECQTYPNVYPRQYWGSPNWELEDCDPIGGIQYRTIVDGIYDVKDPVVWNAIVSTATAFTSEAYNVCDEVEPEPVDLHCDYCEVFFLGKTYNALKFGTDDNGYDYMYYGTPEWFIEEKLAVGESKEYNNGWTLTINDLGIYENKVYSTITNPSGATYDYVTVIDTYTSQVPSNGEGDSDNWENQTIAFTQDTFEVFTLCGDQPDGTIELDEAEVVFAVKFVKTLIGAAGNYIVEYHAYDLKDYGVLKEQIYPGPCETDIEPAIKVGDLEWYFDIIPNDEIQFIDGDQVDLDNEFALWEEGNPNYDAADMLTIYNPLTDTWGLLDDDGNLLDSCRMYELVDGTKYYDSQDELWYGDFDPICAPILELWLATPVELAGLCDEELNIALNDCDGNNYFTLNVSDEIHTDYVIDGEIEVYRKVKGEDTVVKKYVTIDPDALVKLDENITAAMKQEYNLVLIGGPVANAIVQELVDLEYTTFEKWDTSAGEWEIIEDVFGFGKDVLIVAGMDRDATSAAALDLIAEL